MVKKILLTQGKFALVDDEDYKMLNQFRWYAHKAKGIKSRKVFYVHRKKDKKTILMHRFILDAPKGFQVDHINGNGLDNRKSNLRIVTSRQNQQNRQVNCTSKYPGVCWSLSAKKWMVDIKIKGKKKYLGYFKTEKEAFQAYKSAVHELTGEKLVCEV